MLLSLALANSTSPTAFSSLLAPIIAHINTTWPGTFVVAPLAPPTVFPSFYAWFQKNFDNSAAGEDMVIGSRLLDRAALTTNLTANALALEQFTRAGGGTATAYLVSGPGVHSASPRGGGNAVLPAWRKAYVHATNGVSFPPLNATARRDAENAIDASLEGLRAVAPDMGAYVNEAYPQEPNWQRQFWGESYDRLLHIKRAVDPEDILWCHPCVGNERWEVVGDRLCRRR